ncbi:hypothetical protein HPB52_025093 [Rhipicephalus sanguineus]|uniref:Uncharacterized protein n=1 Tax=Rhipicephalus sanguineus TaxID=34632 RepID=A0A9D4YRN3_RHISA|nr:hypothetical protein HPB52_025093 [Rhipicephalus sanguineus]
MWGGVGVGSGKAVLSVLRVDVLAVTPETEPGANGWSLGVVQEGVNEFVHVDLDAHLACGFHGGSVGKAVEGYSDVYPNDYARA